MLLLQMTRMGFAVGRVRMQARCTVLGSLQLLAADPQLLVDLFVNYDCDFESTNIFERTVTTLVKVTRKHCANCPLARPNVQGSSRGVQHGSLDRPLLILSDEL